MRLLVRIWRYSTGKSLIIRRLDAHKIHPIGGAIVEYLSLSCLGLTLSLLYDSYDNLKLTSDSMSAETRLLVTVYQSQSSLFSSRYARSPRIRSRTAESRRSAMSRGSVLFLMELAGRFGTEAYCGTVSTRCAGREAAPLPARRLGENGRTALAAAKRLRGPSLAVQRASGKHPAKFPPPLCVWPVEVCPMMESARQSLPIRCYLCRCRSGKAGRDWAKANARKLRDPVEQPQATSAREP